MLTERELQQRKLVRIPDVVGLPLRSSIDVVVFAIACMGLNILVGHTGLVSFGHGAWFGLGAYAAALTQRHWFPGAMVAPALRRQPSIA